MSKELNKIKTFIRLFMSKIAKFLNNVSNGKITPNGITLFGFIMHIPIAYLIATGNLVVAGLGLIIFGLFDTLDGELARLQKSVSNVGGFLDASTDRLKEVLLYSGVAYYLATTGNPKYAVIAVIACGASLSVSYVKAKGEAIVASSSKKIPYPELNKMFSDGFFPFEIRMTVLVLGLFTGRIVLAVSIIAIFSTITVFQRLYSIAKRLQ